MLASAQKLLYAEKASTESLGKGNSGFAPPTTTPRFNYVSCPFLYATYHGALFAHILTSGVKSSPEIYFSKSIVTNGLSYLK